MRKSQKAGLTRGDPFRPLCNCNACDRNECPHVIKIKKHDCLHITENNVDYELPSHSPSVAKRKGSTSNSSTTSTSKPTKKRCRKKKETVDMTLLDGIDQDDCCCEVVARAIADNPRHLGLATLRESVNEGKLLLADDVPKSDNTEPD